MSQQVYRGNLSSAAFPFVSKQGAQTVIMPGPDQNFNRQLMASSTDTDKDVGVPQAYYMHNVMPTGDGYMSVGYETVLSPAAVQFSLVDNIYILRDGLGNKVYFGWDKTHGRAYFLLPGAANWSVSTTYDASVPFPAGTDVTIVNLAGIAYVCFSNTICCYFNFSFNAMFSVNLVGLSATGGGPFLIPNIIGITQSNGYLIAYSKDTVFWSSTISDTDFTPSLETGAGSGSLGDIRGSITCAVPTANGFLVYSSVNAVAAMYTGNSRYPFQFNECIGSGGVLTVDRVAYEAESGFNYAYTSKGMQTLQAKSALTSFPDLTDFLAGQYIEDFDEDTLTFIAYSTSQALKKKMVFIAARYLVISYGEYGYTHAIVYDTVQKRFGKLKIDHIDCVEWEYLNQLISDIPRKSIAFVMLDGTIKTVDFSVGHTQRTGVILLGKFQYVRSRNIQLQEAEYDWIIAGDSLTTYAIPTYDGKTPTGNILGTVLTDPNAADIRRCGYGSPEGRNFSLLLIGSFNLNSFVIRFNETSRV